MPADPHWGHTPYERQRRAERMSARSLDEKLREARDRVDEEVLRVDAHEEARRRALDRAHETLAWHDFEHFAELDRELEVRKAQLARAEAELARLERGGTEAFA